jgi:hypothetical protein
MCCGGEIISVLLDFLIFFRGIFEVVVVVGGEQKLMKKGGVVGNNARAPTLSEPYRVPHLSIPFSRPSPIVHMCAA